MKLSPREPQEASSNQVDFDSVFGSGSAGESSLDAGDFPAFGAETRSDPIRNSAVGRGGRVDSDVTGSNFSRDTATTGQSAEQQGESVASASSESSVDAIDSVLASAAENATSSTPATSRVLTPSGKEVASATNTDSQRTVVSRPPIAAEGGFNALDPSSYGNLIWVPVGLLALFAVMLFRWVLGTSSSDDLARYKYRGPKVADPDAPDTRGRFKKRPSTNDTAQMDGATAIGVASLAAVEDDLDFFDDSVASPITNVADVPAEAGLLATMPAESDEATLENESETLPSADHADHAAGVMPVSEKNTMNDSEDDFDFLSDDEPNNRVADAVEPTAELSNDSGADELADQSANELADLSATASSDVSDVDSGKSEFDLSEPESQADEDDIDFFDDDSDAGFSFDESDAVEEPLAAAPMAVGDTANFQSDQTTDAAQMIESDDFADSAEFADVNAVTDNVEQPVVAAGEGADVASVAKVAAVAGAATAGGSWLSRLFARKKSAASVEEPIVEQGDEAIAAANDVSAIDSEDLDMAGASDDALAPVATDESPAAVAVTDDAEFDVISTVAAEADDDDDFGMFDDDSDADYQFDSDDDETAAASLADTSVSPEPGAVTDAAAMSPAEPDALPGVTEHASELDSADSDGIHNQELADSDASDSFDGLFEEEDDELQLEADVAPIADADADLNVTASLSGDADESVDELPASQNERLSVAEASPEVSPGAGSELDLQVQPLTMAAAHDELPLLEDQLLDEIIDEGADADLQPQTSSSALSLAALGTAAAGVIAATGAQADVGASADDIADLKAQVAALESANKTIEQELVQAKDALALAATDQVEIDEAAAKLTSVQEELETANRKEEMVRTELATAEELKQNALHCADELKLEIKQAKAEAEEARAAIDAARAEAEEAAADAARARAKAEEAAAEAAQAKADLAAAESAAIDAAANSPAEQPAGSLGGSLLAAAGGGLAAMATASALGGEDADADSNPDDPFRLPPEKVKVMLLKLKTERKKRLKTKEYLLAAQAKKNEVTESLAKVQVELESLKSQLSGQNRSNASGDDLELSLADDDQVPSLQSKLDAEENAQKKS